jgi:hypothetical protein
MEDNCVVLVSNFAYFDKTFKTIQELRTIGNYNDTIVLITDNNSILESNNNSFFYDFIQNFFVTLKIFENIDLTNILDKIKKRPFKQTIDGRELTKTFQWHKIHLFDIYFKQWKNIFYIDSGMNIYKPIDPFWEILKEYDNNVFIAHSDTYPLFENNYKDQFDRESYPDLFKELETFIDLSCDNFQSGILLFNTNIIKENTKIDLIKYANKFHISTTNEQGIMNIYFNGIHKLWKPLPVYWNNTFTYDYWNRDNYNPNDYIMTKYTRNVTQGNQVREP